MSAPTRPDIEALKQLVATRRADERYDTIRFHPYPSEADPLENAIAYIEHLEHTIRQAIDHLDMDEHSEAWNVLSDAKVPEGPDA